VSALAFTIALGLPAAGSLTAWVAAVRGWRTARGQIPQGSDFREVRGRIILLVVLSSTLIVFGLVVSLLLLGEMVSEGAALPAALAYGVPGLLAGLGMSIMYWRGTSTAVASKQAFARVLTLALLPENPAVLGLVVSILLIRSVSNAGVTPHGAYSAWLASALAMIGSIGGLLGAAFAVSSWDFTTQATWPKALVRSARGGYATVVCFALAMAVLGEWLVPLLIVLYFGGGLGIVLFIRARRKGRQRMNPP
jgi:F0F1-type ATP synthase membrane subunit c/vacuolar-type H+-ATPase subunit K